MAELVRELVPSMEQVRMVSSGTEATMSAIRLPPEAIQDVIRSSNLKAVTMAMLIVYLLKQAREH